MGLSTGINSNWRIFPKHASIIPEIPESCLAKRAWTVLIDSFVNILFRISFVIWTFQMGAQSLFLRLHFGCFFRTDFFFFHRQCFNQIWYFFPFFQHPPLIFQNNLCQSNFSAWQQTFNLSRSWIVYVKCTKC